MYILILNYTAVKYLCIYIYNIITKDEKKEKIANISNISNNILPTFQNIDTERLK